MQSTVLEEGQLLDVKRNLQSRAAGAPAMAQHTPAVGWSLHQLHLIDVRLAGSCSVALRKEAERLPEAQSVL